MRDRHSLILAMAAALAACGGDSAEPLLTATVDTVAGVERLTYPAEPAASLGWGLDTAAVLGDAFAEDAYQFDQVSSGGLASDAAGNLYILDRQGKRVLKYSPQGEHLATFGREGEGPGELSQPISMTVGPGDTIWVSDFSNGRITGFPQDADDPRTIGLPEGTIPGSRLAALPGAFVSTLRPLMGIRVSGGRASFGGAGGGDEDSEPVIPLIHANRALDARDTVWSVPEPPRDMVQLEAGGNVMITMMQREFWPDFQWDAFADGSVALSDTSAYLVHLVDPSGSPRRMVARNPAPRPTTEADREVARQRVRDESAGGGIRIGGGGGPDEDAQQRILEQRLEKMTFADLIPRITALRVDPSGRIWVGVSEDTPDETQRIDVYDRDGTLLGELRDFPFPDVFLGSDRIGVLRRDDLDVQQVVILEIERPETEMASG